MKVCFLLQRRFAYLGHDLAAHLKNRHGIEEFCGYVQHRPSYRFLTSQKEIKYSTLLLDEDLHKQAEKEKLDPEYIKFLENEYGLPNLWPYIEVDRVIRYNQLVREYPMDTPQYSHREMMVHVQVRARAIIEMLTQERPDYVFCSAIGSMSGLLLYQIAKKMGIKVQLLMSTMIKYRYTISDDYESLTMIDREFEKLKADGKKVESYKEAKKLLEEFRKNPAPPDSITSFYLRRANRLRQLDFLLPSKLKRYFNWLIGRVRYYLSDEDRHDYSYIKLLPKIKDQITRKFRTVWGVSDLYDEINPDSEDFGFFPLHLEPEVALHLYGYWNVNQLETVRQVARSLPVHFKLYVKEHPRMMGHRTRRYYKELKKIPNIKLVNPRTSSLQLLSKAKLVTVISGSAGWEALQLKVPVITFGKVFFNQFSMVKNCSSFEELPYLVKEQLERFNYKEDEMINYIGLILKHSASLDLPHLWHRESDKVKRREKLSSLAGEIIKQIDHGNSK